MEDMCRSQSLLAVLRHDMTLKLTVAQPSSTGVSLDGQDGHTRRQDRETVLVGLSVKDFQTRSTDDTGLDALLLQLLGGVVDEVDLGTGRDQSDIG
jgi:hypothetical protein